MASDIFNRSLTTNQKIMYFFGAWLLACFVLFDAVSKFIDTLGYLNVIILPENFTFLSFAFSEGFLLNILKIAVLLLSSVGFGILYTYLARRINLSDKVSLSISNALLYVLTFPLIVLFIAAQTSEGRYTALELIRYTLSYVIETPELLFGVIVQLLILIVGTFIGFVIGRKITLGLPEERGKLIGVKWFHYVWLTPAISVYAQSLLFLIYLSVKIAVEFLAHFNPIESIGRSDTNESSIQGLILAVAIYYGIGYLILQLGRLQLKVLVKKSPYKIWKRVGISLLFGFIIPAMILLFTVVGNYA